MPTMYEIYEKHADQYDELVSVEDYQGNLRRFLLNRVEWAGAHVLEAGVGTGRVTQIFADQIESAICCDRSAHMLDFAKKKLSNHQEKLGFVVANNLDLPDFDQKFDVFIQGWSFGHQVVDCNHLDEIEMTVGRLVQNSTKNIRPGGKVIYIETLGTNQTTPQPPHEKLAVFYKLLEQQYQFERNEVQTDFRYASLDAAVEKLGFFFGDEMARNIREQNSTLIPEWTGIWVKQL